MNKKIIINEINNITQELDDLYDITTSIHKRIKRITIELHFIIERIESPIKYKDIIDKKGDISYENVLKVMNAPKSITGESSSSGGSGRLMY